MSFMDKIFGGSRLSDEEYDEYDEYEDIDEEEDEKPGFFSRLGFGKKDEEDEEEDAPSNLTPMRGGKSKSKMNVCVIKPSTFDDVKEISDTLLSNTTIILNMEGIDLALAQRIIDFMMGACYAIDGNLQKISNYIFIITPAAVGISGDLQGLVDAFENSRMVANGGYAGF